MNRFQRGSSTVVQRKEEEAIRHLKSRNFQRRPDLFGGGFNNAGGGVDFANQGGGYGSGGCGYSHQGFRDNGFGFGGYSSQGSFGGNFMSHSSFDRGTFFGPGGSSLSFLFVKVGCFGETGSGFRDNQQDFGNLHDNDSHYFQNKNDYQLERSYIRVQKFDRKRFKIPLSPLTRLKPGPFEEAARLQSENPDK